MLNGDTICLCAADGEGNAVSLIQSNYMGVGAGLVVPGYGIELHNRGCYFTLDPGHPNAVAPRQAAAAHADSLDGVPRRAPGDRPRHDRAATDSRRSTSSSTPR